MSSKQRNEETLFKAARQLKSPSEQNAYLEKACGNNKALLKRVKALLRSYEHAQDFLEVPPVNCEVTLDAGPLIEGPGTVIGPYKLLEQIGEGGMAVVYMAEQTRPLKRRVAIKIIKLGMDTKEVMARFDIERQALAMMDHPNIAKVLDAGATETGRPYFVMELVRGVTITEYCDKNKLNTRERLELFLPICHAVHHAHQKGIIHRDLKPSNIMVTLHDSHPVPMVIDFGIAKATNQKLTENTVFTRYAQMIGTPEYMSPEQAEMSGLDIDTRTDIYSLGVVLYELLIGTLPFDAETLRSAGIGEIQRIIREEEPCLPSTRLSTLGAAAEEIAARRGTNVTGLARRLHRELEWIPMKAIRKDRTRRYGSASEFADDIKNYLSDSPLIAGPESVTYRLQKFVQKQRVALTVIAIMVTLLVAGLFISTMMYRRAQGALDEIARLKDQREADRSLNRAQKLRAEGRYEAALEEVNAMINRQALGPEAHLLKARLLYDVGQFTDAEKQLLPLTSEARDIAGAAHCLLARIYLGIDSVKAKEHKELAESMLPNTAAAFSLRAMTVDTSEESHQWLSKAITRDPNYYPACKARALLLYGLKHYEDMTEDVAAMIALRPKDFLGYSLRAVVRRETGRFEEAIEDLFRAIELCTVKPEMLALHNQRRETYSCMGDHRAALADALYCAQLEPKDTSNRLHVFTTLVLLKEYEAAKQEYEKMMQEDTWWAHADLFRRWLRKYVFVLLETGQQFDLPADVADKAPFSVMHDAAEYYRWLEQRATRLPVAAEAPCSWSPDGKQLVYERNKEYAQQGAAFMATAPTVSGPQGLYILNLETHTERLLATFGMHPAWSPDGRYIAFRCGDHWGRKKQDEIMIIGVAGGEPRHIALGYWPVWGMKSNRLYFRSVEDMLCCMDVEDPAAHPKTLLPCPGYFALSPDEETVAIACDKMSKEIRIVNLSSGSVITRWIPPLPQYSWAIKWSPNGKELSLGYWTWHTDLGVWMYNLERGEAYQVLDAPTSSSVWSLNGSRMAIHVSDEIWLAELDPNVPTYQQLGTAVTTEDFLTEALSQQTRRIATDPLNPMNFLERSLLHMSLQNYDLAKTDLEACGRLVKGDDDPILGIMNWWAGIHKKNGLKQESELLRLQVQEVKDRTSAQGSQAQ